MASKCQSRCPCPTAYSHNENSQKGNTVVMLAHYAQVPALTGGNAVAASSHTAVLSRLWGILL